MAWIADELVAVSGGDWTTLNAFESDHDGDDPTGQGDNCQARIKGVPADTGQIYWIGWQAGATSSERIVVKADGGQETDGTDGTGDKAVMEDKFHLEFNVVSYMDIIGIEFDSVNIEVFHDGGGDWRIAKCFLHDVSAQDHIKIVSLAADLTIKVGGCLFDAGASAGAYGGQVAQNDPSVTTVVEVFNCTFANSISHACNERSGSIKLRNSAGFTDNTRTVWNSITDENYCAADDASGGGANSVADNTLTTNDSDDFSAPSTQDYTVFDINSVLYEAGEARAESWFTELCPTDLNGVAWRATPSIGCYELSVVGAPTFIPKIQWLNMVINPWTFLASVFAIGVVKNSKLKRRDFFNISKWVK